ncbi:MAG TPA: 16S rRNA (guanine(966)-N(2))-methyltransferase RsmD [Actinomycetota bacterium]|nr:16S rRNA (guanine(966)-N(2))-methyltransferase RsmD [Actinomycetota bacterium]
MRVVAGSAKGTRLAPVPAGTRPVSDRAREGLFSSLGAAVEGARVLDLYAGTGAMGIEALSRGAASAMFVDSAPAAAKTIAENLRRTRLLGRAEVRRLDVLRGLRQRPGQFDLVLADPPYKLGQADLDALVAALRESGTVAAGGRVALTRRRGSYIPVIPVDWHLTKQLTYGDALVLVFRAP